MNHSKENGPPNKSDGSNQKLSYTTTTTTTAINIKATPRTQYQLQIAKSTGMNQGTSQSSSPIDVAYVNKTHMFMFQAVPVILAKK
jgi:hypothetical protein